MSHPIYVLAGQSNAGFLSLSFSFMSVSGKRLEYTLFELYENGVSLSSAANQPDWYPFDDGDQNTGELFDALVASLQSVASDTGGYFAGLIWVQGEADARFEDRANSYQTNLEGLISGLRASFGSDFDIVIVPLSTYALGSANRPFWSTVRDAQFSVAADDDAVHLLDTDPYIERLENPQDAFRDGLHYTSEFADIVFREAIRLLGASDATGITAPVWITDPAAPLVGSEGSDSLHGLATDDEVHGGEGADFLYGYAGNDLILGGAGNDLLNGGGGDDSLAGGLGDDTYYIDSVFDVVSEQAGEGFDRIYSSINLNPFGSRYANVESFALIGAARAFHGTKNGDEIIANPTVGSRLFGYSGVDTIIGGEGDDRIFGGFGDDIITGAGGSDLIDGQRGADEMRGGAGNDIYVVNDLGDLVIENAGEGTDNVRSFVDFTLGENVEWLRLVGSTASVGNGNALDNIIVTAGGSSTLRGFAGDDFLRGSQQADVIYGGADDDTVNGLSGDDQIFGDGGNDFLNGSNGNDVIEGGNGDDLIYGGRDNDTITGGADKDTMRGDIGADTFIFADGDFAGLTDATADRILDFDQAEGDVIDLSLVDAITGGSDDAFTFIADAAFSGTAGELRFEQANGATMVYMDVNGDMVADHAIALTGLITLTEADFIL